MASCNFTYIHRELYRLVNGRTDRQTSDEMARTSVIYNNTQLVCLLLLHKNEFIEFKAAGIVYRTMYVLQ